MQFYVVRSTFMYFVVYSLDPLHIKDENDERIDSVLRSFEKQYPLRQS
jgi:hypothetical protein